MPRLSHYLPELFIGAASIATGALYIYAGALLWAWADTALFAGVAWATLASFGGTLAVAIGGVFAIIGAAVILDLR